MRSPSMATENTDLAAALLDSIALGNLKALATDGAESLLDTVLEDGVAKEIPIFGVLALIISTGAHIRDRLFAKKLHSFLVSLSDISETARAEFLVQLDLEGNKERVAQALLLLLERLDDFKKPEFLARVFQAAALGRIVARQGKSDIQVI